MRTLFILFAIAGCGNHESCSLNTNCSNGSANYYQLCNGGTSDDCYYLTRDGHKFHCLTCGDCDEARSLATTWCSTAPTTNTTTSNGGGTRAGFTCSSSVSCPSGGHTYSACASSTGTQCTYRSSDGTYFDCNSCSDCSAAVQNVLNWCSGGSSSSSSTSSGGGGDASCHSQTQSACQTCCAAAHRDGANYYADAYLTCGCQSCASACNTAGDVCHGGSSQSNDCANCLNTAVQQNCLDQINGSCSNNAACSQYLSCVVGC